MVARGPWSSRTRRAAGPSSWSRKPAGSNHGSGHHAGATARSCSPTDRGARRTPGCCTPSHAASSSVPGRSGRTLSGRVVGTDRRIHRQRPAQLEQRRDRRRRGPAVCGRRRRRPARGRTPPSAPGGRRRWRPSADRGGCDRRSAATSRRRAPPAPCHRTVSRPLSKGDDLYRRPVLSTRWPDRDPRKAGPDWRTMRLAEIYPGTARELCELDHDNPFQLLVGHDPVGADHRRAGEHGDARALRPVPDARGPGRTPTPASSRRSSSSTGFFRNKTKSLIGMATALVERFDGEVPPSRWRIW